MSERPSRVQQCLRDDHLGYVPYGQYLHLQRQLSAKRQPLLCLSGGPTYHFWSLRAVRGWDRVFWQLQEYGHALRF